MTNPPKRFLKFLETYPEVGQHYQALGKAVSDAGPLDKKTIHLIKIGVSVGAQMDGAIKSHIRKALEVGASPDEIRHAILQATTTVGFPTMMIGMAAADDLFESLGL